jgi:arsenate reductase
MKPAVLFLCTGNSCRSQMAEGWLRHLAGGRFEVLSAGTSPVGLNPRAVIAMAEAGIDISRQWSKHMNDVLVTHPEYVVTVCDRAKETCPAICGGAATLHWSFDDPAEAQGSDDDRAKVFRRVRDEIGEKIRNWLKTEGRLS